MKVMITGASGLLGRAIYKEFKENTDYELLPMSFRRGGEEFYKLDLTDSKALTQFMEEHRPDMVIHAAAERHPDVSQKDPEGTKKLNIAATENLAVLAKRVGGWLLYISTDYVFDGTSPSYSPGDQPNPLNFYGESKLDGEGAIKQHGDDYGILRVPILYGGETYIDESAISLIIGKVMQKELVNMDHWAHRYPTHVGDVAIVCRQISEHKLSNPDFKGTWHWSGNECLTKYEMALIMARILRLNTAHILPDDGSKNSTPRPKDCHLDTSALTSLGFGHQRKFEVAIAEVISELV